MLLKSKTIKKHKVVWAGSANKKHNFLLLFWLRNWIPFEMRKMNLIVNGLSTIAVMIVCEADLDEKTFLFFVRRLAINEKNEPFWLKSNLFLAHSPLNKQHVPSEL